MGTKKIIMKQRFKETVIRSAGFILIVPAMIALPFAYVIWNKNPFNFVGYMIETGTIPPKQIKPNYK